jgi:hypothetical protein
MAIHKGSCHCGNVAFEVESDLENVYDCNCSHCSRKGFLLNFVPKIKFNLLKGKESLAEYKFNKKHISHQFCTTCGVQPFGEGSDSEGNEMVAVNTRCLEDVDASSLPVQKVDGKSV